MNDYSVFYMVYYLYSREKEGISMKKILYLFVFLFSFFLYNNIVSALRINGDFISQNGSTIVTDFILTSDGNFIAGGYYIKHSGSNLEYDHGIVSCFLAKYDMNMNKLWEFI